MNNTRSVRHAALHWLVEHATNLNRQERDYAATLVNRMAWLGEQIANRASRPGGDMRVHELHAIRWALGAAIGPVRVRTLLEQLDIVDVVPAE